tara:strand:+ start:380 stop:652 length:273 start_codon:yes stop_codon:yes gene_type:complete
VILRDEKNASQQGEDKKKESKRERSRHPKQNHFFGSDLFERNFFLLFMTSFCVSENNYISSKLYLFIKRTAHHHTKGVLLRDINKHTRTA